MGPREYHNRRRPRSVLAEPVPYIPGWTSKTQKKLSKLELSSEEKNQRIKILETELDSVQQATDLLIHPIDYSGAGSIPVSALIFLSIFLFGLLELSKFKLKPSTQIQKIFWTTAWIWISKTLEPKIKIKSFSVQGSNPRPWWYQANMLTPTPFCRRQTSIIS